MRLMMAAKTIIRRYNVSDGRNDSLELNLSYESSSFDESIDDAIPLGTKPYLFEPEVSSEEESTASSPEKSTHERMVKTVNVMRATVVWTLHCPMAPPVLKILTT